MAVCGVKDCLGVSRGFKKGLVFRTRKKRSFGDTRKVELRTVCGLSVV